MELTIWLVATFLLLDWAVRLLSLLMGLQIRLGVQLKNIAN
jgi:hypothetical protein